jgi:hypothetical protein
MLTYALAHVFYIYTFYIIHWYNNEKHPSDLLYISTLSVQPSVSVKTNKGNPFIIIFFQKLLKKYE